MAPCRNVTPRTQKRSNITIKHVTPVDAGWIKQAPTALSTKTRRRDPRHRLCTRTYHNQTQNVRKSSRTKRQEFADVLRGLHLPSSRRRSQDSDGYHVLSQHMRWAIDADMTYWAPKTCESERNTRASLPSWNQVPTCVSHLGIYNLSSRFRNKCWNNVLEVPSYWPVFDAIDSERSFLPSSGQTDSSAPVCANGSEHTNPTSMEDKADIEVRAGCCSRRLLAPRLRRFWTFLSSMVLDRFQWCTTTHDHALRRNERRHVGYLDLNQSGANYDLWPQSSMESLLSLWESAWISDSELIPSTEIDWPSKFGRLIANVVATEKFTAQCRQQIQWPEPFVLSGPAPVIDFTCRVSRDIMGWPEELCPLLFAAQCAGSDHNQAITRLAKAFQPMITLLTLYYLDCRASRKEEMPSWMILFGVIYDESGLSIRAHYPCFNPPPMASKSTRSRGWGAASRSMGNNYISLIHKEPHTRGSLFATLNRIQGHCLYVMEKLQSWNGFEAAVSRLLI